MILTKGANAPLPAGRIVATVSMGAKPGDRDVDISAYVLRSDGKVRGDDDMTFYNQPSRADGSVSLDVAAGVFAIDFERLPRDAERIAICVVVSGGSASVLESVCVSVAGGPSYKHETAGQPEAALIVAEFYRRNGAWKMRAVGAGYASGLGPLAKSFGMDVVEEDAAPAPPAPAAAPRTRIDLRKDKVSVSLKKLGIADEKAEIVFVIDASGSMVKLYTNGTVQETVERIVPVALRLDDDGRMQTWFYATKCLQAEALTAANVEGFVAREMPYPGFDPAGRKGSSGSKKASIGYGNEETVVMEAILGKDDPMRTVPLLVIFLTDGGIDPYASDAIKDLLRMASSRAIFWQFVGVGQADYGVLRELDTIGGRKVDNAGFFDVDDLSRISDDDLYDRILSEFPIWLKAVRAKGIL